MHALRSMRTLLAGLGLAAFVAGTATGSASAAALPRPGTSGKINQGLFAKAISFINVNRVYCGVNNIGQVCVDSSGRGTTQGGYWPRGSADNYVFNSGLQVAGIIQGNKATNPWAGDTTGGWFFDGAGGRQQTEGLTNVFQATNPVDVANWPSDAYVPQGDSAANVYDPALQGLVSASQGDVHFVAWEANPKYTAARSHPLGIVVDYRLLAWNYPAGAQDVVFLVATVYNITSANQSDYAQHRCAPDKNATGTDCTRDLLWHSGQKFQALSNAQFHITLPQGGYTIGPMYMAAAGDNDVGNDGNNFNGVILPFAMGYTYDANFAKGKAGWTFDPAIFAPPFFAGVGFVGYKYLKGPEGPGVIQLFTTFCNGGAVCPGHSDPGSTIINYRLLAGTPAATDGQCNIPGIPAVTHVCFMLKGTVGADTRLAESSSPLTLAPGEARTIVIAYIFAPPVAIPGFTPSTSLVTDPGDVTWSNSADSITKYNGLNRIDSLSGFIKYTGPNLNADGSKHTPLQTEFTVVRGSLLGKALVAQSIFDLKFLQPFAPDAPPFFLIGGDRQVTVLWKPSATETTGDPYFAFVSLPTAVGPGGTQIPNSLYDPNYRKFDVEGYRIYRGRSDTPSALHLLVQFDYAGTKFNDFTGTVLNGNCAPELGVATDCPKAFPTAVTPTPAGLSANPAPGSPYTVFQAYNIGPQTADIGGDPAGSPLRFIDLGSGSRIALAGGTSSFSKVVDTVSVSDGFPALQDNGVPFIFIDQAGVPGCQACGVVNGVTYYYSVTAFDVNAPGHGPTSLESAKVTKQVVPSAAPGNYDNTSSTAAGIYGRSGLLTDNVIPTLDTNGAFSKKFPPSDALTLKLAGFAPQLFRGTSAVGVQYDSTTLTGLASAGNASVLDWYTGIGTGGNTAISLPFAIPFSTAVVTASGSFTALSIDSSIVASFGGGAGYSVAGSFTVNRPGSYWTGTQGRGCANSVYGVSNRANQCYYSGPRWFVGANGTTNPEVVSPLSIVNDGGGAGLPNVNYNNAGVLPGVKVTHYPYGASYLINAPRRDVDNSMSPFVTAADYKLYWGAAGKIDSVIDVTHDEPVPFKTTVGASWGIINEQANTGGDNRTDVTADDISCVAPLRGIAVANPAEASTGYTACGTTIALENTAKPGKIAFFNGHLGNALSTTLAPTEPNKGFMLYIKGRTFIFELTGDALPAAGTVWTERDFVGIVYGGNGPALNAGAYQYIPSPFRPFTAPGASAKFSFTVNNALVATTGAALNNVHTVPDPYYVTSAFDLGTNAKDIQFINVPVGATIRIYTTSGILIRVLQNNTTTFSGLVHWDVRNRTNQFVASGVYFYNVELGGVSHTGRMTVVNYASTVQ